MQQIYLKPRIIFILVEFLVATVPSAKNDFCFSKISCSNCTWSQEWLTMCEDVSWWMVDHAPWHVHHVGWHVIKTYIFIIMPESSRIFSAVWIEDICYVVTSPHHWSEPGSAYSIRSVKPRKLFCKYISYIVKNMSKWLNKHIQTHFTDLPIYGKIKIF